MSEWFPPLFASLTGLHLAVLQFCYFFLLLTNVTSTYITYMTVVLAWMAGTVAGLWWRIRPEWALVLGVVSYYGVYALILADPLAPYLLPLAGAGVMVTGLWAGRFFMVMRSGFGRTDRLFFHENNGFMSGIVAVFVGFTLLGQGFLLWAPGVSVLVLLVCQVWWREFGASQIEGYPEGTIALRQDRLHLGLTALQDGIRRFAVFMGVLNLVIPAGIFLYASATGRRYWHLFWGEDNLITWFSSVQLMIVGVAAWLCREVIVLVRRLRPAAEGRTWIWAIFASGFFFLALDERFRVHEQVRDLWLRPAGWFTGLDYLRPGDVGLYFYLLVGLGFTVFLIGELRRHPLSLWFFGAAVGLATVVAVIDSLPESLIRSWPAHRFWTSAFEEIAETAAQLLFLWSFLVVLRGELRRLSDGGAAG